METTDQDLKELRETLTLVRIDLGKLDTKLDQIKDLNKKVDDIEKIANEALQSARAAHHRLDDMQVQLRWMIGTTISVMVLFLTALGLLWKVATHG